MAASWLGLVVPFLARFAALVYRQTSYPKANTDYTAAVMLLSIHTWWVHTHARAGR